MIGQIPDPAARNTLWELVRDRVVGIVASASTLLRDIATLKDGKLADVCFYPKDDPKPIRAHKVIVAARCKVENLLFVVGVFFFYRACVAEMASSSDDTHRP